VWGVGGVGCHVLSVNKRYRIPKGKTKMDNPDLEKLAT
jgi:hypothetical protein